MQNEEKTGNVSAKGRSLQGGEVCILSRQHLMLNLYRLPDGRMSITVKNHMNINRTLVNDMPLDAGTLVVTNGDTITLGDTVANLIVRPVR